MRVRGRTSRRGGDDMSPTPCSCGSRHVVLPVLLLETCRMDPPKSGSSSFLLKIDGELVSSCVTTALQKAP